MEIDSLTRLIDREYLVRLQFRETILGSRPTESIAAKWVQAQERAKLERSLRAGAAPARFAGIMDPEAKVMPGGDDAGDTTEAVEELAGAMLAETTAGEGGPDPIDDEETPESRLAVTGFSQDPDSGILHLWDFQVMGFLKGTAQNLDMKIPGKRAAEIGAARQIQTLTWVFSANSPDPFARQLFLTRPNGDFITEPDGIMDRPLRAMTARGERVSIAISEQIHPPAECALKLVLLKGNRLQEEQIEDLFTYGLFQGLGQWRSGGWGRFRATIERTK